MACNAIALLQLETMLLTVLACYIDNAIPKHNVTVHDVKTMQLPPGIPVGWMVF